MFPEEAGFLGEVQLDATDYVSELLTRAASTTSTVSATA